MNSSLSLALLQQIIDQLPMNIFCRDKHGRYLFANKAFAREAGLQDPSELIGKSDAEMPWGDVFREEDDRLLADGKPLLHQQLHCHSGEGASWMEINKVPLYDEHGDPIALFAMVSAIDQRKELEQTFRQQQLLQRRLLDAIPDLIRLEDHQGVLIDCNQAFLDFMGLVASEALGRRVPPRLPVEQTLGQGEYCVVDAQGRGRHLEVTRVEVPDDEGNSLGILTLSRDITGLRTTQAQLQQEQHYDSLTGLLKLSHFLQTSRHLGARKASLLLVDLQHFREINDRFGIRVADRLLSQVARRLQRLAGRRWTQDGAVVILAQETRSQARNRELAREKLAELIQNGGVTGSVTLQERLRETALGEQLDPLWATLLADPAATATPLRDEFVAMVEQFYGQLNRERVEQLTRRAAEGVLSESEKRELGERLRRRASTP